MIASDDEKSVIKQQIAALDQEIEKVENAILSYRPATH
jgi:prefoldin subunit 5